jgi:hypothetical protein
VEENLNGDLKNTRLIHNKSTSDAMSLEKIYEEAKIDFDDIEQRIPRFWNDLSTCDVAAILRIVSDQFFAVHNLLEKNKDFDRHKLLSQEQMLNIMGLFQELVDNFFPMAHTQERFGRLKIINGEDGNRLHSFQEHSIDRLSEHMRMMSALLNEMQREFNDLKQSHEEFRTVLNP